MPEFVEHITEDGQRWDQIAFTHYGDASLTAPIIAANRSVAISRRLKSGIPIYVPVLSRNDKVISNQNALPPWRQAQ